MTLSRRAFLRASGVSIALPALEAFRPRLALGSTAAVPRRMICINSPLGLHPPNFFPAKAGKEYELSPYLEPLKNLREDFTVISGLTHPEIATGHDSGYSFLTGAHHNGFMRGNFRNTISVDQLASEKIGGETRVPSLTLSCEGVGNSWTRSGARIPAANWPANTFSQLFIEGSAEEVEAQRRRLRHGQSILDQVRGQVKELEPVVGVGDREKIDEYLTSVRELEQRLVLSEAWSKKPKPKVDAKPLPNASNPADFIGKARLWFDLIVLAFQTDSTRLITVELMGTSSVPPINGVTMGHHDLSHHGQDPKKLEQLRTVELELMKATADLLTRLKEAKEEGSTLLDRTMFFLSSNLGNASSHATTNMPVLFAGGGFKHGQHLAFDPKSSPPLCNLFVSMLQRLGLEVDRFGSSTGTLTGLETTG